MYDSFIKKSKPFSYRCYLIACLIDVAYFINDGIITEGKLNQISQILTKTINEPHTGVQAISMRGIEILKFYTSISATTIWNGFKLGSNDLVKSLASKILTKMPASGSNLSFVIDYLENSYQVKVVNNILIILLDVLRKRELAQKELLEVVLKLMKLLENVSPSVRGKVYLCLSLLACPGKAKTISVVDICTAKVIATVERELRRNIMFSIKEKTSRPSSRAQTPAENQERNLFLTRCLSFFGKTLAESTFENVKNLVEIFNDEKAARIGKNEQIFLIKTLQSSVHLSSSAVFRKLFVNDNLIANLVEIFNGLIKISTNVAVQNWYDEVMIELLVVLQSVACHEDFNVITR